MLVVKVELHSAITGQVSEIGRMVIYNDGTGTKDRGNYVTNLLRKGTTDKVQRRGFVTNYPRLSYSVWELVKRALTTVVGKGEPIHPGTPGEFDVDVAEESA